MGCVWVIISINSCFHDVTHFSEGTKRALAISRLYSKKFFLFIPEDVGWRREDVRDEAAHGEGCSGVCMYLAIT